MITDAIQTALITAIAKLYQIEDIIPEVTYPEAQFGDFATNVAFRLAKPLKKAPKQIGEELAATLVGGDIAEATAINGYINLKMHNQFWVKILQQIDAKYGDFLSDKPEKIQVEFISANPTGPLTLGNGRGGYSGDVLANVLATQGHTVDREYYLNDAGNQVEILKSSIRAAALEQLGLEVEVQEQYKGEYIQGLAEPITVEIKNSHPKASEKELTELVDAAINKQESLPTIIGWIKAATKRMGINYDTWFSEQQELHDHKAVDAVITTLSAQKAVEEREGATWLKGDGDENRDRVLVKSDGTPTYLAADLAYHYNKFETRGYDRVINLWGADHGGQVRSLQDGVKLLGIERPLDVLLFQLVRLIKDGQEFKVSKRAGTYVTMDELLDEAPSDVWRFFFLMRSANTAMDLDLDLAKEQSQKNPLYYVMYSYARAHSIIEQASSRGISPINTIENLSEEEVALTRHLSQFPALLQEVAGDYGVHHLTFFGIEAAKRFHDLYESERIIDLDKAEASRKLFVIAQYITFMERYFAILGVTPIKRMEHSE
jgi:arginyl-tRNA synthetase